MYGTFRVQQIMSLRHSCPSSSFDTLCHCFLESLESAVSLWPWQNFVSIVVVHLCGPSTLGLDLIRTHLVSRLLGTLDPGSWVWTLGPIWIVIVHAWRPSDPSGPSDPSEPSDPSRLLLCMLEGISQLGIQGIFRARPAPGQSWAPEFYGASS